jgi:hypothetical protein
MITKAIKLGLTFAVVMSFLVGWRKIFHPSKQCFCAVTGLLTFFLISSS